MARQISRGSGSRGPSRENSVEGRNMRTPTPTRNLGTRSSAQAAPVVKQMSREDWETKMASVVDEYLHNKDIKVQRLFVVVQARVTKSMKHHLVSR